MTEQLIIDSSEMAQLCGVTVATIYNRTSKGLARDGVCIGRGQYYLPKIKEYLADGKSPFKMERKRAKA
jgi:predicted DNA-binding transcriptional regulator AlpA